MASSSALSLACAASTSLSRAAIGFRYSTEIIVKRLNNYSIFNWLNYELSPGISIIMLCVLSQLAKVTVGAVLGSIRMRTKLVGDDNLYKVQMLKMAGRKIALNTQAQFLKARLS